MLWKLRRMFKWLSSLSKKKHLSAVEERGQVGCSSEAAKQRLRQGPLVSPHLEPGPNTNTITHVLRRLAFFRSKGQDGQLIVGEKGYKYPSMPWIHCISDGGTSRILKTFLINERHDLRQQSLTLFQSKCCCAYGMLRDYRTRRLIIKNENYVLGTVACRVIETFRASLLLLAKYSQFQSWKGFYMFSLFSSLLYILFIFYSFLSSILNYF